MNIQDSNSNVTQDNLLIVNELKKVNQKLSEIQQNNLDNNNRLKIVQYGLITISGLLFIGLFSNLIKEKYEYQVVSPSDIFFDEDMNKHGKQGWKATECRRATSSINSSVSYECIMIRKK
jgi:hypothetical protein